MGWDTSKGKNALVADMTKVPHTLFVSLNLFQYKAVSSYSRGDNTSPNGTPQSLLFHTFELLQLDGTPVDGRGGAFPRRPREHGAHLQYLNIMALNLRRTRGLARVAPGEGGLRTTVVEGVSSDPFCAFMLPSPHSEIEGLSDLTCPTPQPIKMVATGHTRCARRVCQSFVVTVLVLCPSLRFFIC